MLYETVPVDEWPRTKVGEDEHFAPVGRLVSACSYLEMSLHTAIKHCLALGDDVSRLIVGEPAFSELSAKLLAVLRLKDPEYAQTYELLHGRIAYVNEVRRWVAHKPFASFGPRLIFTNVITAKSKAAIKGYVCTTTQLRNLAALITHVSNHVVSMRRGSKSTPEAFRKDVAELLAFAQTLDLPPSPDHTPPQNQTPQSDRPKAGRQRGSSRK